MIEKQLESPGYLKSLEIKHGQHDQSSHGRRGSASGGAKQGKKIRNPSDVSVGDKISYNGEFGKVREVGRTFVGVSLDKPQGRGFTTVVIDFPTAATFLVHRDR